MNKVNIVINIEDVYEYTIGKVGGLDKIIIYILNRIKLFVEDKISASRLNQYTTSLPYHILLHARSGIGKSLLIQSILDGLVKASSLITHSIINSPSVYQTDEGDTERYLTTLFNSNNQNNDSLPSIIVFEEIDSIAVKITSQVGYIERKVSNHLMNLLSSNSNPQNIHKSKFIIGITSRIDSIDDEFFSNGRFDSVIQIPIPSPFDRKQILNLFIKKYPNYIKYKQHYQELIDYLAESTHGYVGADLHNLTSEALIKKIQSIDDRTELHSDTLIVDKQDFKDTFEVIKPSILNEYKMVFERIEWNEIGGLDRIIDQIQTCVLTPIMNREPLRRLGVSPPTGILLYGPPGNGKSLIARAIASSSPNINFISVQSTDIISPVVGESEKKLSQLFKVLRSSAPAILFLDQIEVLGKKRGYDTSAEQSADRLLSCLLVEMDGMFSGQQEKEQDDGHNNNNLISNNAIIILGATTRIDLLDPTLLRPGRFDYHIEIPQPDVICRRDILYKITKSMPVDKEGVDFTKLAEQTNNYSGADLNNLCKEAALLALRNDLNSKYITMDHFNSIISLKKKQHEPSQES